jgi:CubicO group peptidase (beta-lactamase class C family)
MSKQKEIFIIIILFVLLTLRLSSLYGQEQLLRNEEPIETVIADLKIYIPARMHEADIPGLAIALIHGGQIVWKEGFGVSNIITGKLVTPETLFEIASNSKVVTAYTALQLVDQGKISLDKPADSYLSESWLPQPEYRDKVTIRHLLSHSSGLPHSSFNKNILFEPGTAYSYSGYGFLYLQEVIENITGHSLEDAAKKAVFQPLEMSSSSFLNRKEILPQTANGHIRLTIPVLVFVVPFIIIFVVVGIIWLLVKRIITGKWRPLRKMLIGSSTVSFCLLATSSYILFRKLIPEFWWLMILCFVSFAITFAIFFLIGKQIIRKLPSSWQHKKRQLALKIIWVVLIISLLCWITISITNIPVPKWPAVKVNAAGTMRTTVADLAAFLIEVSNPRYLSEEIATQMLHPQISASDDISWGLGLGIQHSQQGDAIWQWGQTLDFQSIMVIYPELGFGVVVFTNSDFFHPLIVFDVAQRALGGKFEGIRRAASLEFNR